MHKKFDLAEFISRVLRSNCVVTLAYILIARGWNMYVVSDLSTGYSAAVNNSTKEALDAEYNRAV